MAASERPRRPRGDATRVALIDAAQRVVERDGVAAATTRQIAEEAGLPLGAVHYWFEDKDALLRAVIENLLAEVRLDVQRASESAAAQDRLSNAYDAFTAMPLGRQLALFELTTYAIRRPGLSDLAKGQYGAYRASAAQGMVPWEGVAARLPGGSAALSALIVAVIDGLTLSALADPEGPSGDALTLFGHLLSLADLTEPPSD